MLASDDTDERGIGTSTLGKAETLLRPKASKLNLADFLKRRKPAKEVFDRLQVRITNGLLDNHKFVDWVKYVDDLGEKSGKVASTIPTLTAEYGDEALFKILDAAMQAPSASTQRLASRLHTEQIAHWAASGKSPIEIFKIVGADKPASGLLTDSRVADLVKYFGDWVTKHTDEAVSMLPGLIGRYDDEVVFKILEAAKKTPSTQSQATKLQAEQIQHWTAIGKSPTEVLKILGVDKTASGLFTNSHFTDLVKYFGDWNTKHTDEAVSLVSKVAAQYGDDILFKILQNAKRIPNTESVATKLQSEQIQYLLTKNEHPGKVFGILGLHELKANEVLSSPLLKTWLKYLDDFKTQNPKEEWTLYIAIRAHFDVGNMVNAAMKNPITKNIANRVQAEKLVWNLRAKQAPADLFYDLIGRHRSFARKNGAGGFETIMKADNFLADPMFKMWTRYLNDFNKKYPDKKTNMIKSLLVYYTDDTLSQALILAKQTPNTEKMATNMQLALLNKWAREKKPPAEVSKLLVIGSSNTLMKTYTEKYNWALKNVVDDKVKVLDDLKGKT